MSEFDRCFWEKHPGLVWSNPAASDSVRIRAALLRPRFFTLLDIAVHFGIARLRTEWEALLADPQEEADRVRKTVERCLENIEEGARRAAA
jgi:hypothetical protein